MDGMVVADKPLGAKLASPYLWLVCFLLLVSGCSGAEARGVVCFLYLYSLPVLIVSDLDVVFLLIALWQGQLKV